MLFGLDHYKALVFNHPNHLLVEQFAVRLCNASGSQREKALCIDLMALFLGVVLKDTLQFLCWSAPSDRNLRAALSVTLIYLC